MDCKLADTAVVSPLKDLRSLISCPFYSNFDLPLTIAIAKAFEGCLGSKDLSLLSQFEYQEVAIHLDIL